MRSNLRIWWPELAWVLVMAGICLPLRGGVAGFAIMIAFTAGFWWMGYRHRHLPLWEVIRRMDSKLDAALTPPEEPESDVRHLHSV